MISLRFYFFPPTFKASFLHPTESLFVPASVVSFGTILINISQYGLSEAGPWLDTAVYVLFWANGALAIISSCGIYLLMYANHTENILKPPHLADHIISRWSTQTFTISTMNPLWIFPAYPMLIIGPHAGYVSGTQIPERGANIIIGGVTIQGIGFLFSMMVYAAFINRLMTNKLPKESTRPSMFVSVGPSGFTASGLINMGANAHQVLPKEFMGNGPVAAMILKVTANFVGIIVWGYVDGMCKTYIRSEC